MKHHPNIFHLTTLRPGSFTFTYCLTSQSGIVEPILNYYLVVTAGMTCLRIDIGIQYRLLL